MVSKEPGYSCYSIRLFNFIVVPSRDILQAATVPWQYGIILGPSLIYPSSTRSPMFLSFPCFSLHLRPRSERAEELYTVAKAVGARQLLKQTDRLVDR
jgi:hypothetical protein